MASVEPSVEKESLVVEPDIVLLELEELEELVEDMKEEEHIDEKKERGNKEQIALFEPRGFSPLSCCSL